MEFRQCPDSRLRGICDHPESPKNRGSLGASREFLSWPQPGVSKKKGGATQISFQARQGRSDFSTRRQRQGRHFSRQRVRWMESGRFGGGKTSELRELAPAVQLDLEANRGQSAKEQLEGGDESHIAPPGKLLDKLGMEGRAWVGQPIDGSPLTADLAEPGVYPIQLVGAPPISRRGIVKGASLRSLQSEEIWPPR